jgi:hypothetical protein
MSFYVSMFRDANVISIVRYDLGKDCPQRTWCLKRHLISSPGQAGETGANLLTGAASASSWKRTTFPLNAHGVERCARFFRAAGADGPPTPQTPLRWIKLTEMLIFLILALAPHASC